MATAREIRSRIGSINNTKTITRAMEMIAASKMKKARDRMEASRPYAQKAREVIAHLGLAHPEYKHPYLLSRPEVKHVGFIIVSTDRGLCGGLNINLFRMILAEMKSYEEQGIKVKLAIIGHKAEVFFKRLKCEILAYAHHLGDTPAISELIGSVKVMLDGYEQGEIDRLYLCANEFDSTISQKPYKLQLLPIEAKQENLPVTKRWDYIYEPDAKSLLNLLLTRYIESQVYQGVVENIACEQASKMMAMKNATENAGELIKELKLEYNKARQASITRELAEIVSGADAIDS